MSIVYYRYVCISPDSC